MTVEEILKHYRIVRTGIPKKGEMFITHKNHDVHGNLKDVTICLRDMRYTIATIVERITT